MASNGKSDRDQTVTSEPAVSITGKTIDKNHDAVQRMIRAMEMDATAAIEDGGASAEAELAAILNAESDEDIWAAGERGPLNAQHLAGCELAIVDMQVKYGRDSDIKTPFVTGDGKQMYLLVTAYRLSKTGDNEASMRLPAVGEEFQFNTSAPRVAGKLWAFYTRGRFGSGTGETFQCLIHSTDLGGGQAVLKLRQLPGRTRTESA